MIRIWQEILPIGIRLKPSLVISAMIQQKVHLYWEKIIKKVIAYDRQLQQTNQLNKQANKRQRKIREQWTSYVLSIEGRLLFIKK